MTSMRLVARVFGVNARVEGRIEDEPVGFGLNDRVVDVGRQVGGGQILPIVVSGPIVDEIKRGDIVLVTGRALINHRGVV